MSWFYAKSGFDLDAQAYFDRITVAGGSISNNHKIGINNFVIGSKAASIWSKLLDVGPLRGDSSVDALVKLKKLSTGWSYGNVNFVSGDYSTATGLIGNGSSKWLQSGVNPSTMMSVGDTGLGVYDRSTYNSTPNFHGSIVNSSATLSLYNAWDDNKIYSDQYNETGSAGRVVSASAQSGTVGFVFATRTTAPLHAIYRNGSQIVSSSGTGGSLPNAELYFFARNLSAGGQLPSAHRLSFLCITSGMDSTEAATLNTLVQALESSRA